MQRLITLPTAMLLATFGLVGVGVSNGQDRGKDFWKEQEKAFKEQRKQQEKFWKEQRKREERARKDSERRWRDGDDHFRRGPSQGGRYGAPDRYGYDSGWYGNRGYGNYGYGDFGYSDFGYGYREYGGPWTPPPPYAEEYGYPPAYPYHRADDLDAVYTPWGFYQEVPRSGYGRQPKGYRRISPYPFEVWGDD